jgi:transposase-like protein
VKEWNERPLTEAYPFVMVDAMVLKVRKGGQVRPQSALIAVGVNMRGYREVQLSSSRDRRWGFLDVGLLASKYLDGRLVTIMGITK